jgi:hypothetical protein|tara:strand:- start:2944 stop:3192 length:249 start_codon:yes stop_codon:yes gene_type:complete
LNNSKQKKQGFNLEKAMNNSNSETIAYRAKNRMNLTPWEARKHLYNLYSWNKHYFDLGRIGHYSDHAKCELEIKNFAAFYNL